MIRRLLSTLLTRVTTDVDALRAENAHLSAMCEHYQHESTALERLHDRAVAERDRLRVIAGNTDATPHESLMLGIVRASPGLLASEYGTAFAKVDPEYPTDNPNMWIVANNAKLLSGLHRKGFVRREREARTYRYWPEEAPRG